MNLNQIFLKTCLLTTLVSAILVAYSDPSTAQEEGCVTTDQGVTVCGQLKQTEDLSPNTEYRKEVNDFVILFQGCKRSSDKTLVKCRFQINNQGKERSFQIRSYMSSFVDSSGISYNGSIIDIGGNRGSDLETTISPGINYVAVVTFKDVPQKITQVPLLNLFICPGCSGGNNKLQFRNITFSPDSNSRTKSPSKPSQSPKESNSGKYGTLVTQDSQQRVNVRDEPGLDAYKRHYGLAGDIVLI